MTNADPSPGAPRDKTLGAAITGVVVAALVLTLGALVLVGVRSALGVALGGAIAALNLVALARIVRAFLEQKGNTAPWAFIAVLKFAALIGCAYLVIHGGIVSPLAVVTGYGALPLGATFGALFAPKPPDDPA